MSLQYSIRTHSLTHQSALSLSLTVNIVLPGVLLQGISTYTPDECRLTADDGPLGMAIGS